jgi:hypothetical protein
MKKRDRKELKACLRCLDQNLQLRVGGSALKAIGLLTPHRAAIPGSTVDEALDAMRLILTLTDEMQTDLAEARRLLKPSKKRKR